MADNLRIPHPVGSDVWVWSIATGREPVQRRVKEITIWIDTDGPRFSYTFEPPHPRPGFGLNVFGCYEDAVAYRDAWIREMRESFKWNEREAFVNNRSKG